MKHVKTYENIEFKLKLYAVWDNRPHGEDTCEIIQITDRKKDFNSETNFIYFTKTLYDFDIKTEILKKVKSKKEEFFNEDRISTFILFTSDYIEDCIAYIESLSSVKKYNL